MIQTVQQAIPQWQILLMVLVPVLVIVLFQLFKKNQTGEANV